MTGAPRPSADGLREATIVLTGATGGIGHATALAFAPTAGQLLLHGLEPEQEVTDRLATVRAAMRPGTELRYFSADYGVLADVVQLAGEIRAATDRVDLLVNNAGKSGPPMRTETADGNEATLQANYLAPVLLTAHLEGLIGGSGYGRIVNIASSTHLSAALLVDDLNLTRRRYAGTKAYGQSKLALVIYSRWLAAHRPGRLLDIVSMHPGVIATPLLHDMFATRGDNPKSAAEAILSVAARRDDNGTYYDQSQPASANPRALDPDLQEALHLATENMLQRWLTRMPRVS